MLLDEGGFHSHQLRSGRNDQNTQIEHQYEEVTRIQIENYRSGTLRAV